MTIDRPAFKFEAEELTVWAADPRTASRVASAAEQVIPGIRDLLDCPAAKPTVWVLEQPSIGIFDGMFVRSLGASPRYGDVVVLGERVKQDPRYILAHELVHWYSGTYAVALPQAVEEGLADLVVTWVLPGSRESIESSRAKSLGGEPLYSEFEALAIGMEDWMGVSAEQDAFLRAIGFRIAVKHGVEWLGRLRERAREEGLAVVPVGWLLDEPPARGPTDLDR